MEKSKYPNPVAKTTTGRGKETMTKTRWQERLLPVMGGLLIGLTIFFFIASFVQMTYLHKSILNYPVINLDPEYERKTIAIEQNFDDQIESRKLELTAIMEAYVIERRYHEASVALMAGIWFRYLGFVTGMVIAIVGASFVLGKLSEAVSNISGKTSLLDFSIQSTSPGIILVFLGVVLMFATITDRDTYEVNDDPVYFTETGMNISDLNLRSIEIRPTLTIPDKYLTPEATPTLEKP